MAASLLLELCVIKIRRCFLSTFSSSSSAVVSRGSSFDYEEEDEDEED